MGRWLLRWQGFHEHQLRLLWLPVGTTECPACTGTSVQAHPCVFTQYSAASDALRALRSMVDLRRAEPDGINQSVSSLTVARSHHYHPSRGTTMWREMSALKWATTA